MYKNELVYLTGLSIDKKSLNEAYKNISTDIGVIAFTADIKTICQSVKINKKLLKELKEKLGDKAEEKTTDLLTDFIITSLPNFIEEEFISWGLKSLFGKMANKYDNFTNKNADKLSPFFSRFLIAMVENNTIKDKVATFEPLDFFNVYLSNQSDSRGVPAIAKLSTRQKGLRAHWGYCDRPFYMNRFIDSIEMIICNDQLKDESIFKEIHDQYIIHGLDIVFSKLVEYVAELEQKREEGKLNQEGINKLDTLSNPFVKHSNEFSKKAGKSLSERGFFGIDLLSRIIYKLHILKLDTDSNDTPLVIRIDDSVNQLSDKEESTTNPYADLDKFFIELLEISADPTLVKIISGKTTEKYDLLIKRTDRQSYYDNPIVDHVVKGDAIKHAFINKRDHRVIIPIKLFLSLPLVIDEKGAPNKVSQKQLLPDLLTTDKLKRADVLTTGGVEHNRPLMHLVNAHRKQRKEKRVFGFLDNHFDFIHRWNHHETSGYRHYFIMGVSQPVSGFNEIYIKRTDNEDGLSDNPKAKHLIFKVRCDEEDKDITVLAIYGFSALSSVYATFRIITKLLGAVDNKKKKLLKNIDKYEGEYRNLKEGFTWLIEFAKDTEKKMYKASHDVDPFSVVTSKQFKKESKKLVKLFKKDARNGGVLVDRIGGKTTNE